MIVPVTRAPGWLALAALFLMTAVSDSHSEGLNGIFGFGAYSGADRLTPVWLRSDEVPLGTEIELVARNAAGSIKFSDAVRAGSGVRVPFYASASASEELYGTLTASARILAEIPLGGRGMYWPGHIILASGLAPILLSNLSRALEPMEPIKVIPIALEDFPASPLALDGISAIVLADGLLSSFQVEALGIWLACGGSMAVVGARSGGIADMLAPGSSALAIDTGARGAMHRVGLGRLVVFSGDAGSTGSAGLPGVWGSILGLDPFEQSHRPDPWGEISPARGWGRNAGWIGSIEGLTLALAMVWALGLVGMLALARKRRTVYLTMWTALWLAAACLGAGAVGPSRPDQAVRVRLLLAPGNVGALASIVVAPPDPLKYAGLESLRPSRTYVIAIDAGDRAVLTVSTDPDLPPRLVRASGACSVALRRVFPGGVEAAVWFARGPGEIGRAGLGPRTAQLSAAPDRTWQEWDRASSTWLTRPTVPAWVGKDAVWLFAVADSMPGTDLLFGRDPGLIRELTIDGHPLRDSLWIRPLVEGEVSP
ncbi:MAG: hypothetical protein E4H20_05475 [Spirochaetales bacterium]|nr:MAG: hypothetical protein E4H20_05475 [Spirochaetales bacterium]